MQVRFEGPLQGIYRELWRNADAALDENGVFSSSHGGTCNFFAVWQNNVESLWLWKASLRSGSPGCIALSAWSQFSGLAKSDEGVFNGGVDGAVEVSCGNAGEWVCRGQGKSVGQVRSVEYNPASRQSTYRGRFELRRNWQVGKFLTISERGGGG